LKKSEPIKSSPLIVDLNGEYFKKNDTFAKKEANSKENSDVNGLDVITVSNTTNWADSYLDVLVNGAYDDTIKNDMRRMEHIHDHQHNITAKIANVKDVKAEDISFQQLGLKGLGAVQCLVFYSNVRREYNQQLFNMYAMNQVKQHSIGFQYLDLVLCINDSNYKDEFANWQKYYNEVMNKKVVDKQGYFWAVTKVKVYENSAVLWGANELTPTLSISNLKNAKFVQEEQEEQKQEKEQEQEKKDIKTNSKLYLL